MTEETVSTVEAQRRGDAQRRRFDPSNRVFLFLRHTVAARAFFSVRLCDSASLWFNRSLRNLRDLALAAFVLAASAAAAADSPSLIDAAKNADTAVVRALLSKKVDVNVAAPDGTTALHWASYRDDLESADLLLRAGAKVNAATDLGVTPLWNASLNGSERMVRRLLEAGADPNAALSAGETPVMVASRGGYPPIVERLIAKGGNVNVHGARGQTALMWAVAQKHPEVVKVLLAHRADLRARSNVWGEVMAVPPHGHLEYNRSIPNGGDTALMFAARVGDLASAKLLVAARADVNDRDAWGVSATAMAAHAGHRELVDFLLDQHADPNAAAAGFSALHVAIMRREKRERLLIYLAAFLVMWVALVLSNSRGGLLAMVAQVV